MRSFEQMTAAGVQEGQAGLSLQQRITLAAAPNPLTQQQLGAVQSELGAFDIWRFLARPAVIGAFVVGGLLLTYMKARGRSYADVPVDPWTTPEFQATHCAKYPQDCAR